MYGYADCDITQYECRLQIQNELDIKAQEQIKQSEQNIFWEGLKGGAKGFIGIGATLIDEGTDLTLGLAELNNKYNPAVPDYTRNINQQFIDTVRSYEKQTMYDNFGFGKECFYNDSGLWDVFLPGVSNLNHIGDSDLNEYQQSRLIVKSTLDVEGILAFVDTGVSGLQKIGNIWKGATAVEEGTSIVNTANKLKYADDAYNLTKSSSYRNNFIKLLEQEGIELPRGYDVDHLIPQQIATKNPQGTKQALDILDKTDINDPTLLQGIDSATNRGALNQEWSTFIANNPKASGEQIVDFYFKMREKYMGIRTE